MLLPDLYTSTLIDSDEEVANFLISLNVDHCIYQGHFPNIPVLPGVCTLQIIKECAASKLKKMLHYQEITSSKFLVPIVPTENPSIQISLKLVPKTSETYSIQAEVKNDTAVFLKLKATLALK